MGEGWIKANLIALLGLLISGGTAYGVLSSRVDNIDNVQHKTIQYIPQFIQVQTELKSVKEESERTRKVWEKLDSTLDALNDTLIVQGGEIRSLQRSVDDIKHVVIKETDY